MNLEQIRKQIDKIFDDIKLKSEDNYKYVFPIFLEILNSSKTLQKEITKNSK